VPKRAPAASSFDTATTSAYGTKAEPEDEVDAEVEVKSSSKRSSKRASAPVTEFRTVDSGIKPKRALGPEVEREAELVRHLAPVDPEPHDAGSDPADEASDGETADAASKPVPAWRRTAMAELTALAADSDDLTPRRRR
jgi:hypothetical protein